MTIEQDLNPDLIFLDLNMPRMDGKECLRELRKIDRLKQTPVIIYATSSEKTDIIETRRLGASDYLEKQSSVADLQKMLAHFFK